VFEKILELKKNEIICYIKKNLRSQSSVVGITTRLWIGRSGFWIREQDSSVLQNVQTVSGTHPTSYSVVTGVLPRDKEVGAWGWPLTSIYAEVKNEWSRNSAPSILFHGVRTEKVTFIKRNFVTYHYPVRGEWILEVCMFDWVCSYSQLMKIFLDCNDYLGDLKWCAFLDEH
jgi:hypothetical protein